MEQQFIKGFMELTYVGKDEEYQIYKITSHTIGCHTMQLLLEEMKRENLHGVFDFTNKRLLVAKLPF